MLSAVISVISLLFSFFVGVERAETRRMIDEQRRQERFDRLAKYRRHGLWEHQVKKQVHWHLHDD